jgi:glycosyltransferase involved in cell wall biosynthesis
MTTLLRQVFKQRRCIIAPNAQWMVADLERRFGDIARILPIPFGIDRKWYELSRQYRQKPLKWLVVLRLTRRKMGYLFTWGEKVFSGNHELHLFGPMQEPLTIPAWVHYHGATHPEVLQDIWFPQASGLISLSQHDEGRPQVMLEAMAAGLPIIASRLAAHTDLVTHQETGWLTDSLEDFIEGIEWLSVIENNERIGNQARTWVKENIGTWEDCAKRYIQSYQELL